MDEKSAVRKELDRLFGKGQQEQEQEYQGQAVFFEKLHTGSKSTCMPSPAAGTEIAYGKACKNECRYRDVTAFVRYIFVAMCLSV